LLTIESYYILFQIPNFFFFFIEKTV